LRILSYEVCPNAGDFSLRSLVCHTRLEAADSREPLRAPDGNRIGDHRVQIERQVEISCAHRSDEVWGQHANDRPWHPIDPYVASEHARTAREEALPGGMRHQHGARGVRTELASTQRDQPARRLIVLERSAKRRRHAERVEEPCLDPRDSDAPRSFLAAVHRIVHEGRKGSEALERPLPLTDFVDRACAQRPVHVHQMVRVGVRERVEQHRLQHTENGSVDADPQRQRHNGDSCESGRSAEEPQCVSDVLKEGVKTRTSVRISDLLFDQKDSPHL
jgi:hypothetical protein